MVNVTEIKDDSNVWRKGSSNPEINDLINKISTWQIGVTYQVSFEKSYKSLRSVLKSVIGGRKKVSLKMSDKDGKVWFIKIDKATRKRRTNVVNDGGS